MNDERRTKNDLPQGPVPDAKKHRERVFFSVYIGPKTVYNKL